MHRLSFTSLFLFAAACADPPAAAIEMCAFDPCTSWGSSMPGSGLDEGGEMLLERRHVSPAMAGSAEPAVYNTFHAYAYAGGFGGAVNAPAPGTCTWFEQANTFPFHDIPASAEYVDWGESVTLLGPGFGEVTVPKVLPDSERPLFDNRQSPARAHEGWIYGGPTWQDDHFQDLTLEDRGVYHLRADGRDFQLVFPPSFAFAENAGTDEVVIPASTEGWELSWEAVPNPNAPHGYEHTFVYVLFSAFAEEGDLAPTPLVLCQPEDTLDGSLVIPQDVLDALPAAGTFETGRQSHYMDALDVDGDREKSIEDRRFDCFAQEVAVSSYVKETP